MAIYLLAEQERASMTPRDSTPEGERHARKGWSFFSPPPSHWEIETVLSRMGLFLSLPCWNYFSCWLDWLSAQEFHCFFPGDQKRAVSASVGLSTLPIWCCWVGTFFVKVLFHGRGVVVMGGGPPLPCHGRPKVLPGCSNCSWGCFVARSL